MKKYGFTLLEIMIAIGIIAVICSIILSAFVSFRKAEALDKDTELVVEVLRDARSKTLSSQNSSQYGVHFASSKITSFTGSSYSAGAGSNQDFPLFSTDTVLTITLTGGGSDVVFNRLSGESNQNGTIVLSSPTTSRTKTVTIYKTGLVESN